MNNFKIVLLGDSRVGKTAISFAWVREKNGSENYLPTVGATYLEKIIRANDREYLIQLWDTAGDEKYKPMVPIYLRNAHGAIIVFDITEKSSFEGLNDWICYLKNSENIPYAVVGNKIDLMEQKEISIDATLKFCEDRKCSYFETSAVTGENIDLVFHALVEKIISAKQETHELSVISIDDMSDLPVCWFNGCSCEI